MNNLVKDLLIGLQPAHLVTLILLILLAGCDYHSMPSDVRKSLNLAGENKKELLEVRFSIRETTWTHRWVPEKWRHTIHTAQSPSIACCSFSSNRYI